jgi:hypothetical protein
VLHAGVARRRDLEHHQGGRTLTEGEQGQRRSPLKHQGREGRWLAGEGRVPGGQLGPSLDECIEELIEV